MTAHKATAILIANEEPTTKWVACSGVAGNKKQLASRRG
jgi:hypothetical protein